MRWQEAREIVDFHFDGMDRTAENMPLLEAWSEIKIALWKMSRPEGPPNRLVVEGKQPLQPSTPWPRQ